MKKQTDQISIKIKRETHKRLLKRGTVEDTLDSVIAELLDIAEDSGK